MDELDRYIESIVSKKISEPENLDEIIKEAISSAKCKEMMRKNKIKKTVLTSVILFFCVGGVGVAGYITYEEIWKDPEKYTYEEVQETLANSGNVEKINLITEDEAKKNAIEIMNNLGYSNELIKEITLQKDVNNNDEPFYNIITGENENDGIAISIDAVTGKLNSFTNKDFKDLNVQKSQITENEAREYADKIMEYAGFTDTEYEFTECKEESVYNTSKNQSVWVAKYNKTYEGLNNPYESLTSNFIISNDKIEVSSIFETKDGTYDNNPTVLTEDEAKQIAINKEKELTSKEIEDVNVEMGIRKMNTYIYKLENNIDFSDFQVKQNDEIVDADTRIRKVWLVNVSHKNINENLDAFSMNERLKRSNKMFYIDSTTGEILGGERT